MSFRVPEQYRVKNGPYATTAADGLNGIFLVPAKHPDRLRVIVSDGEGWEHVSVSLPHRTPTWAEMCKVKSLFWDDEDCVMQLHPPRSDWVSDHPYCLHMWRPIGQAIPRPDSILVGVGRKYEGG